MSKKRIEINFVTSNLGKVREFRQILEPGVKVNHIKKEYDEIRSDSSAEIAEKSCNVLAQSLKKTVIVEDSGLFIKALNGFPGTCSKYIHQRIGLDGLLTLLKGKKDRRAVYISAVALCIPGKKPVSFVGREEGKIAMMAKGKYGFGHDPLFIPNGYSLSYGQMPDCDEKKKFRRQAVLKLREDILKK